MTTNKLKMLAAITLLSSSFAFAQSADVNVTGSIDLMPPVEAPKLPQIPPGMPGNGQGLPPPPGNGKEPGFFQRLYKEVRGEKKEIMQDARQDFGQVKADYKAGIEMRKDWKNGSGTDASATPTPWKDFRGDMKDIKNEIKGDLKQMRDDMRGKVASLTEAQIAEISVKTGITVEAIKAGLATGTPLFAIVKDKILPEDMEKIVPRPEMASGTMASRTERKENRQGFFNELRLRIFGGEKPQPKAAPVEPVLNVDGTVDLEATAAAQEIANINASITAGASSASEPIAQIRNFFKRLFNF